MAVLKPLLDEYGIIYHGNKDLPTKELKLDLLAALAELEDNECHRTITFPKTRLHRVKGVKEEVYRADINKIAGWRIHLMYANGQIVLKDILPPSAHDYASEEVKAKKNRYK